MGFVWCLDLFICSYWKTQEARESNYLKQQVLATRDLEITDINETKLSHFPQTVQKQNGYNSHRTCTYVKFAHARAFQITDILEAGLVSAMRLSQSISCRFWSPFNIYRAASARFQKLGSTRLEQWLPNHF